MAALEASITMEEDLFYAAVGCDENDLSSLPVTFMDVKQELVDDIMPTVSDPFVFVNSILPDSELEEDSEDSSLKSCGGAEQSTLSRDKNADKREYFKRRKNKKSKHSLSAKRRAEFLLSHQERAFESLSHRVSERSELARVRHDLRRLKSKYSDRVRELLRLRALNLRLQEQLFLRDAAVNATDAPLSLAPLTLRTSCTTVHARTTNLTAVSRASSTTTVSPSNSPLISSTPCIATVQTPPPFIVHSVDRPEETFEAEDIHVPDLPDSSARPTDEIREIDLENILKVKPGVYGDSMFTKRLAMWMWGPDKLRNRSVKGRKCNSKKGAVARCPLSPEKLKVVKDHFVTRMMSEQPPPSTDEQIKRIRSINGFISDKIITLNRSSM